MKSTIVKVSILILISQVFYVSCKKKTTTLTPACDGTQSSYNTNIKSIIEGNCTSGGCHGSGSSNGDFTTYNGLKFILSSGAFANSVLTNQTMPKGSKLTQDQLNKIQCWKEGGFIN